MTTSGTNQVEISNEAASMLQLLAGETGTNPNQLLSNAIRILRMVVDYERARTTNQPSIKQAASIEGSSLSFTEIEQSLAYALRLLLTIETEGPLNRIILEGPRGKRLAVDPPERTSQIWRRWPY